MHSIMSNLEPNCCLKFNFQKVDQHAGGKWLIHDTKRRKDNHFQTWFISWFHVGLGNYYQ